MNSIVFHTERGEALMEILLEAYDRQFGIHYFRPETHAPQHLFIPKGMKRGDLMWRRWMCRAAGTDRRTVSMRHYQSHAELRSAYPDLYSHRAASLRPAFVEHILRHAKIGLPEQSAKYLPVVADTLHKEFDDNPLHFYRGGSIESLMTFKRQWKRECGYEGLPGYGAKISSLLAIFFEEEKLVKIEDALPVDLHIQRIFISTGIVTLHGHVVNEMLENSIRLFLCDMCARRGWCRVKLAHALWFLGNKGCTNCCRSKDREYSCVLFPYCNGRAASEDYFSKGLWNSEAPSYRKGGSRVFKLEPIPTDSPQQPLFTKGE